MFAITKSSYMHLYRVWMEYPNETKAQSISIFTHTERQYTHCTVDPWHKMAIYSTLSNEIEKDQRKKQKWEPVDEIKTQNMY